MITNIGFDTAVSHCRLSHGLAQYLPTHVENQLPFRYEIDVPNLAPVLSVAENKIDR